MNAIPTLDELTSQQQEPPAFLPPVPESLKETGLSTSFLEQLILKMLYFRGETMGRDLANGVGLKFSLIEDIIEFLKRQHMVAVKRSLGMGSVTAIFCLTEAGRNHAREYLENNQYTGPAPVPVAQYAEAVRAQRLKENWLSLEMLHEAYRHMVVSPDILAQIGPAVSSGKSFLIYGQPGNGKSYLAEALFNISSEPIYIPYAIECQGMIIQMFDPIYHHRIDDEPDAMSAFAFERCYDGRWFRSRRPFIVTGGELSLSMLDLSFNPSAGIYDAPFQLKANNGIYLIDDFGRQKVSPAEVLNRWIVPMERRVDYLTFHTGGKMQIPFEAFLVFSTNLQPEQLGDEAFLRRIQYKMFLRNPSQEEFLQIFKRFCASKNLPCPAGLAEQFLDKYYYRTGKPFRRCHPRDVLTHAVDIIHFEKLPYELTEDLLDRAFSSCFFQPVMEK